MMHRLRTKRIFHPVGQGLFASGELSIDVQEPFRWVYDCGTSSTKKLLTDQIKLLLEDCCELKPRLDLVVVSHFDKDHINGLVELFRRFSVDTLLLPCVPLWQRLVLAFDDAVDTQQPIMSFFLDPVSYISKIPGVNIERVI